jgi:hypothetical protein
MKGGFSNLSRSYHRAQESVKDFRIGSPVIRPSASRQTTGSGGVWPLSQRSGSDINLSHGRSYVHPNVNSAIVRIGDLNVSNDNAGFTTIQNGRAVYSCKYAEECKMYGRGAIEIP